MNRRTASRVTGGVTLGWLACFAYLGFAPRIPDLPGLSAGDEVSGAGHFVASLILAVLVYLWLVSAYHAISRLRAAAIAFGSASAFGLIVELIQLSLAHREPQVGDAVLDVTGSAVGVAALVMVSLPVLRGPQVPAIVGTFGAMLVATTLAAIVWLTPGPDRFCPGTVPDEPLPASSPAELRADGIERVEAGLVGLFDFAEEPPTRRPAPFDLMARGAVEHLEPLGIRIVGADALTASQGPAPQIVDRIVDRFTLEAWVRPANLSQDGPARIVSHSGGLALTEVNFHLGQERHCLSLRIDVGASDAEWLLFEDVFYRPQPAWHLVVTYNRGHVQIFVDGEPRFEASLPDADLSGWSRDYPLLVGNEVTRDRPFRGDVYLVAVYDRALTPDEIAQNHDARI